MFKKKIIFIDFQWKHFFGDLFSISIDFQWKILKLFFFYKKTHLFGESMQIKNIFLKNKLEDFSIRRSFDIGVSHSVTRCDIVISQY